MPLLNGCQFLDLHSTYSYTRIKTPNHNNSSTGTFFFETAIASGDFSKNNVFYHCQGTEKFELGKQLAACHRQGMGKREPLTLISTSVQLTTSLFMCLHLTSFDLGIKSKSCCPPQMQHSINLKRDKKS